MTHNDRLRMQLKYVQQEATLPQQQLAGCRADHADAMAHVGWMTRRWQSLVVPKVKVLDWINANYGGCESAVVRSDASCHRSVVLPL